MPIPNEQFILRYSNGTLVQVESLIGELRKDEKRVLSDDEVGLVIYVGDLGIYRLKPIESGEFFAERVTQISRPRFHTRILRKQIGSTVLSVTEDAIFVIRDGKSLKKVRAEKLKPGMLLATGEKVYR